MKQYFNIILLLILTVSLPYNLSGQTVNSITSLELEQLLSRKEDKLYVINFWATWCPPCIKELPHFQSVSGQVNPLKVEFLFVSLDFPSQVDSHLKPFLKKNKINTPVSVMTDTDYDKWIDKIDPSWQGNIPATLFFNNAKGIRKFHSGELSENQLKEIIKPLI